MVQKLEKLKESPSQTAGPYVHIGLTPNYSGITGVYDADLGTTMLGDAPKGERITITGRVLDGTGTPLRDALLEIWHADASGIYPGQDGADADVYGWGRCPTDMDDGTFRFETIKPGAVQNRDGTPMAQHITFWIVARGINLGLHTRMYFADEPEANAADPVLKRIEHQVRVPTLMGQPQDDGTYLFDIHLQGPDETIFFDI
ncbi:protocatechuate 3,4-dioxygenase subunit alpha [Pseudosulfitobacter pseudonitzschiae]|uniref:protocatechuate 3,4-dioxygenase subunit alpha n=1 Tax=Pseudosulfitobacter pseudonitzschiae TaxID=1402135 RepID=UPI001AF277A3|nr:protocatechuate 3,4-dioxygenase subunit alpha [Pseudosulfitobacter pseudonitzschiae]MBM1817489.1 protocatechuate 3,4-dioxygenase subunit alpha [Pseudosulfitobacter pseudonitzschiae]MBM1834420.1 protocatechuate 3,4-dioxygenase subunit alpha [Pseudosulfitobacter pseudonitzschiae]MBM1839265.1 protocatechuate 3,4-dioxygenase subunit alpha [Pseudosulfitobacter pseudonitzschiae]MBM1844135.1 protocatechuate 3,4-dioxygenase subunit alpha [Pseudosulfitobacter pseudonitzschiae]MBM1848950.1 protocatec